MENTKESSVSIMTNKRLYADIKENQYQDEDDEAVTGKNCPVCGYPTVIEYGIEVCYHCGWSKDSESEGYYEE